jgi:hypothetical protein
MKMLPGIANTRRSGIAYILVAARYPICNLGTAVLAATLVGKWRKLVQP